MGQLLIESEASEEWSWLVSYLIVVIARNKISWVSIRLPYYYYLELEPDFFLGGGEIFEPETNTMLRGT